MSAGLISSAVYYRIKTELAVEIGHIEKKVDVVAVDVAAHRSDTEGHKKGYMVREP